MLRDAIKKEGRDIADADILRRIAAGQRDAFEMLMRRYNRRLYRTARSIVRDDAEAEDVLQEAYLQAFRNLATFRGASSLSTWLTRIVVNSAIARARKTSRRAEVIQLGSERDWDESSAEAAMAPGSTEQPDEAVHRIEMRRLIEKRIDGLPEAFRTVFMMRALEEMTVEETAACLGIPDATVRTRYFRAKGLLRESLSRDIDFALEDAFSFDGARCDRIVAGVLASLGDPAAGDG
ncbi:MAG: RNA polymerase sigma factor [Noviherbaspirillum sp.]